MREFETKDKYMLRRFHFERLKDVSGVSGCGRIADGVVFEDGTAVVHWESEHPSTNLYKSIEDVEFVHGHQGNTKIVFDDPEIDKNASKDNSNS